MLDDDSLKKIKEENKDYKGYRGKMKTITFIVKRGSDSKKIFKLFFKPNNIDFYISFPYYHCEKYVCGTVNTPEPATHSGKFNAVANGNASKIPVKFSYHRDGNIHFKPTRYNTDEANKAFKLASLKTLPLLQREGEHIFTIIFEGLRKFDDHKPKKEREGELEVVLPIPDEIINFEIRGYAASTPEGLDGKIKEGVPPWFQLEGKSPQGEPIYLGFYAIISNRSHIIDSNKNALVVLAGFDRSLLQSTGQVKSLYLWAR